MKTEIILIFFTISIVLFVCFLISKYILKPLFFNPKLRLLEIIKFLDKEECTLVDYRISNKKELKKNLFRNEKGFIFENLSLVKNEYKIVGYSEKENIYKIFWTQIKSSLHFFEKRTLSFVEEKDPTILNELHKNYNQKIEVIKDKCPACGYEISKIEIKCKSCDLNLIF
tara:strand:+ start:29 stop:538 length:510 start_codon:yes stop_codon:yes gene_type:complete